MADDVNHLIDTISLTVVVGVFANVLPTLTLVLTIIWTLIRIYEWVRHRIIKKDPAQFR
jgi:hypothetical protein